MSRVTKLQKQHRREKDARFRRWCFAQLRSLRFRRSRRWRWKTAWSGVDLASAPPPTDEDIAMMLGVWP